MILNAFTAIFYLFYLSHSIYLYMLSTLLSSLFISSPHNAIDVVQHYFSHLPYGGLLGLFVFASAITLLVATVLARQGVDDELLAAEGTAARQETNSRIRGGMDTDGGAVAAAADDIPRRTTGLSMGLRGESLMQIEKQESLLAQQEEDVSIRGRRKELLKTAARLVVSIKCLCGDNY